MQLSRREEWFSLALLSVIIPISFLGAFRLTGILKESITIKETAELETIKWEFQRPNHTVLVDQTLKSFYSVSAVSATTYVTIGEYVNENSIFGSYVSLAVWADLNTPTFEGFVDSIYVTLQKDNQSAIAWVETTKPEIRYENLSLLDLAGAKWNSAAHISLRGSKHSKAVGFSAPCFWLLLAQGSETHRLDVSFELVYYNGTCYKKVVQPFQLKLLGNMEAEGNS